MAMFKNLGMTSRKSSEWSHDLPETSRLPQQESQVHHCWPWISWACQWDWLLQWLLDSDHVKMLGLVISSVFSHTLQISWDSVLSGMEQAVHFWRSRRLEALLQPVLAMDFCVLAKAWNVAHHLPLASSASGPVL
jgi:hypothetical protein